MAGWVEDVGASVIFLGEIGVPKLVDLLQLAERDIIRRWRDELSEVVDRDLVRTHRQSG